MGRERPRGSVRTAVPDAALMLPALRAATGVASLASRALGAEPTALEMPVVQVLTEVHALAGDGSDVIGVTAEQASQIQQFLNDPAVVALLRIAFIRELLTDEEAEELESVAGRSAFTSIAVAWCQERQQDWASLAEELWLRAKQDRETLLSRLAQDPDRMSC